MKMGFEKPEPARPEKPEGLQEIAKDLPPMGLDDAQLAAYGLREIEILLERHADFSVWLAEHGRT